MALRTQRPVVKIPQNLRDKDSVVAGFSMLLKKERRDLTLVLPYEGSISTFS